MRGNKFLCDFSEPTHISNILPQIFSTEKHNGRNKEMETYK